MLTMMTLHEDFVNLPAFHLLVHLLVHHKAKGRKEFPLEAEQDYCSRAKKLPVQTWDAKTV